MTTFLDPTSIHDFWVLIQSEVSTLQPGSEVFHFRADGRFDMYYSNGVGGSAVTKFFYQIDGDTIRYGDRNNHTTKMKVQIIDGVLVILGNHGMESYYNRLSPQNKPNWLDNLTPFT